MAKIQKKINKVFKELGEHPEKIASILKQTQLSSLTFEEKIKQKELEKVFEKFRLQIKKITSVNFLSETILEVKKSGNDRPLTPKEATMKKAFDLVMERYVLIIQISKKIESKTIILSEMGPNFDKYVLSNFYRTMCESSIKAFKEALDIIINFLLNENSENPGAIERLEKERDKNLSDKLTLTEFMNLLGEFDNKLEDKLGLVNLVKEYFSFDEEKGFELRNTIAHERNFLSYFNNKNLLDEIMKVNRFFLAFVGVFYLEILSEVFTKKDLELSKKIFGVRVS